MTLCCVLPDLPQDIVRNLSARDEPIDDVLVSCIAKLNDDVIDDAWAAVRKAVAAGRLQLAKVSTRLTAPSHGNIHIICIYTRDWRDDVAITAAREVLRELGFTEELSY